MSQEKLQELATDIVNDIIKKMNAIKEIDKNKSISETCKIKIRNLIKEDAIESKKKSLAKLDNLYNNIINEVSEPKETNSSTFCEAYKKKLKLTEKNKVEFLIDKRA